MGGLIRIGLLMRVGSLPLLSQPAQLFSDIDSSTSAFSPVPGDRGAMTARYRHEQGLLL